MDCGAASEASFKVKPAGHRSCGRLSSSAPRALRQPGRLTPAGTTKSDAVLPSGEPRRSRTALCGSCGALQSSVQTPLPKTEPTGGPSSAGLEKSPTSTLEGLLESSSVTWQRDRTETEQRSVEPVWGFFVGDDQSGSLSAATSTEAANDTELQKMSKRDRPGTPG